MNNIVYMAKMGLILALLLQTYFVSAQEQISEKEALYYEISKVKVPENIVLEIGGMAFDNKGRLAVCTRRGEVWLIKDPANEDPEFVRFAHGLHEALGLTYKDGYLYVTQRSELTKLHDVNKDDRADRYETIYSWPLEGNYHEYSYGPVFLPNGDMLLTLNLAWEGRGTSISKWRGWMIKVSPDGSMTPVATGMRSPAGFGLNKNGDVFYTENQGDWVGSGRMTHVETGDFVGNPAGLRWTSEDGSPLKLKPEDIIDTLGYSLYEYSKVIPEIKPPSVWFPHTLMGISTSGILPIDHNKFGPFEGQLLVGDQGHSKIMRVYQEKVKGVYQGVCFPFREGFSSGVLRMEWGPDKSLYVGMTSRGWASTGPEPFGLERLDWNGKTPFEMKTIKAMPDGFEIEYTQPVGDAAADPSSYEINDFTYLYHHNYGSPATDIQSRNIAEAVLSPDKRKVRLYVEGLREGFINEIKAPGIRNNQGEELLHHTGYYTLNHLPDGPSRFGNNTSTSSSEEASASAAKRPNKVPGSWGGGPDKTLTLTVQAGLKFDITELRVKAGEKIKLVLDNPDDMLHNLLVVKPGTADKVAQGALDLGLRGQEKGYVPDTDDVLYHTGLLQPNTTETIYFKAPTAPGKYEYVCTFPGHAMTMRGVLIVE